MRTKNATASATPDVDVTMRPLGIVHAETAFDAITGGQTDAGLDAHGLVSEIARALEGLVLDPIYAARLAGAGITVTVDIVDSEPAAALTLLLDRTPIEIGTYLLDSPDVLLRVPAAELQALWDGDEHLPTLIAVGRVGYRGPVRRLLRVLPVLRRVVPSVITTLAAQHENSLEERA